MFATGIASIAIGFAIVGITFFLIGTATGTAGKAITAAVGSIGAIVSNFIGAVYIRMYSETIKSLTEFHSRLVLTHHLHFGNFMTSKIKDEKLREKTLSELTIEIAKNRSD